MSRFILLMMILVFVPVIAFSQTVELLKLYDIPTYNYQSLILNAPNLIDYRTSTYQDENRKYTSFTTGLRINEYSVRQSSRATSKYNGFIDVIYRHTEHILNGEVYSNNNHFRVRLSIAGTSNRYLGSDRGTFLHLGLNLEQTYEDLSYDPGSRRDTYLNAPLGFGYGRIIGVRTVVQAHIISDELGSNLTDDKKIELAELIEKYDNGYFDAKFRDDSEIEYYRAIADITGKPADAIKVKQITESNIYKTSERLTGWEMKAGIFNTYTLHKSFYNSISDFQSDLFASLEYALPINMNQQLLLSANYYQQLEAVDDASLFSLAGNYSIDHTYKWSTSFLLEWSQFRTESGNRSANLNLSAKTSYTLLNSLSMSGSATYDNDEFAGSRIIVGVLKPITYYNSPEQIFKFHLGFSYYLM